MARYVSNMRTLLRKFSGKVAALIAAYAVILQPLFVVLSPPALAHAGVEVGICTVLGTTSGMPAQPAGHHESECCISAGCATGASADLVSLPVALPSQIWESVSVHPGNFASIAVWPNERPHSARAPPA
jgi:hypothetical protein